MAAILASLSPLAELLLQANDPVELAQSVLAEVQAGATAGGALEGRLISEVHDGGLVLPAMVLADIVDLATHTVRPGALIPAAQLVAIVEARVSADHWQLALTIPAFVRGPFADMVADLPSPLRPIETVPAMHMIAGKARERLVLALPASGIRHDVHTSRQANRPGWRNGSAHHPRAFRAFATALAGQHRGA